MMSPLLACKEAKCRSAKRANYRAFHYPSQPRVRQTNFECGEFIVQTARRSASFLLTNVPPLPIIYQDDSLLILDKPAGLLAVPGRGADKHNSLAARVQAEFPDARVVHRLDMATSGLMLFARGAEMQKRLSEMFREREIAKRYVALVAGKLENAAGEIALPLSADWPNRPKQQVNLTAGKPSLTRYHLLQYDAASHTSRVDLEPITGRTHQLRVHLAAIHHPILGDALYGDSDTAPRLLLHARELRFTHPANAALLVCASAAEF